MTPFDVTMPSNGIAHLVCAAEGWPTPEISWQKDGKGDFLAVREQRMFSILADKAFFIIDMKAADTGIYSCIASNIAGTITANTSLTIGEKPHLLSKVEQEMNVLVGENVVLQCMVDGVPKPTIEWLKDGHAIKVTERIFFTGQDQLMVIVEAKELDSGVYQCNISNLLGSTVGTIHLFVSKTEV